MHTFKVKFTTSEEVGVFIAYIRAETFKLALKEAERTLAIDEILAIVRTEDE